MKECKYLEQSLFWTGMTPFVLLQLLTATLCQLHLWTINPLLLSTSWRVLFSPGLNEWEIASTTDGGR
jgi:hypothetical protein